MKRIIALAAVVIAALALVCTAVSCQKEGSGNGVYGVSTKGEASTELLSLADEMHHAVQSAVGTVTSRSKSNDSKAVKAAQAVLDSKSTKPSGDPEMVTSFRGHQSRCCMVVVSSCREMLAQVP